MATHKLPHFPRSVMADVTDDYVQYGKIRIDNEALVGFHHKMEMHTVVMKNMFTIVGDNKNIKIGMPTLGRFQAFVSDVLSKQGEYLATRIAKIAINEGYHLGSIIISADRVRWSSGTFKRKSVEVSINNIVFESVPGGVLIKDRFDLNPSSRLNFWDHQNAILVDKILNQILKIRQSRC